MIREKHFSAFGIAYHTRQFSAVRAFEMLEHAADDANPLEILALTLAEPVEGGEARRLDEPEAIDACVMDITGMLPPRVVLSGVINLVYDFNFHFMHEWQGVRIPKRFLNAAATAASKEVEPMISTLISKRVATLEQLETYYSLEDAFKMFDVIMAEGVNAALSHEAAMKERKRHEA